MNAWQDNRKLHTRLADALLPWRGERKPTLLSRDEPAEILKRDKKGRGAIVFVHGFGGDLRKTWGKFPDFIAEEPRMAKWDIFSIGYPSRLMFDIVGIWSADPNIQMIGKGLHTLLR